VEKLLIELDSLRGKIEETGYITDPSLVSSLFLMEQLQKPLLLEGDAGVGKTEIAKTLSQIHGCELIRLQCYEGLDVHHAVYEWNYQRQLLAIKLYEGVNEDVIGREESIFSQRYLLQRPLLKAISLLDSPVLLIDEIDRADEEFEAYLLELLSDFQVTIPELGTIQATSIPRVILTSNGTRELSDALRRRCLYHYVEYPSFEKELRIVKARLPELGEELAGQVVRFVQKLRGSDLRKVPGIAETLDWAASLLRLKVDSLDEAIEVIPSTLGCLLKTEEDSRRFATEQVEELLSKS
jgi:MoxR-like ATPase